MNLWSLLFRNRYAWITIEVKKGWIYEGITLLWREIRGINWNRLLLPNGASVLVEIFEGLGDCFIFWISLLKSQRFFLCRCYISDYCIRSHSFANHFIDNKTSIWNQRRTYIFVWCFFFFSAFRYYLIDLQGDVLWSKLSLHIQTIYCFHLEGVLEELFKELIKIT